MTQIMGQINYDSWLCDPYIGTTVDDIRIRHDWPNQPTVSDLCCCKE